MEKLYYLQFQGFLPKILFSIFQNLKSSIKLEIYFFLKTIAFSLFQGKIILGLYGNFKKNNKLY